MSSDTPSTHSKAPADWDSDLACPVCYQALHFDDAQVACSGCGRIYPVIDGIPVLIADRATQPAR
jgi:uncharacterized protein YbaR (Trm112 family)